MLCIGQQAATGLLLPVKQCGTLQHDRAQHSTALCGSTRGGPACKSVASGLIPGVLDLVFHEVALVCSMQQCQVSLTMLAAVFKNFVAAALLLWPVLPCLTICFTGDTSVL